jgi:hypothetical protein
MVGFLQDSLIKDSNIHFDLFLLVAIFQEPINIEQFNRALDYFGFRVHSMKESVRSELIEKLVKSNLSSSKNDVGYIKMDSILLKNYAGTQNASD